MPRELLRQILYIPKKWFARCELPRLPRNSGVMPLSAQNMSQLFGSWSNRMGRIIVIFFYKSCWVGTDGFSSNYYNFFSLDYDWTPCFTASSRREKSSSEGDFPISALRLRCLFSKSPSSLFCWSSVSPPSRRPSLSVVTPGATCSSNSLYYYSFSATFYSASLFYSFSRSSARWASRSITLLR